MIRNIFVNLAVRDLKKSMGFFSSLGFEFNPKFTDDKAACMIINGDAYVMLLTHTAFLQELHQARGLRHGKGDGGIDGDLVRQQGGSRRDRSQGDRERRKHGNGSAGPRLHVRV
jgi:hypothetical protein